MKTSRTDLISTGCFYGMFFNRSEVYRTRKPDTLFLEI